MPNNNISREEGSSSNIDYTLKYTESGGLTRRYLTISYDSKTNVLTSSTDISGSNISQKPLSDSDKTELKNVITGSEFFNTKTDYPPEKEEDPSLIDYSLTITMGHKVHTTAWTNSSKEVSDSITSIVDEIKKVVAKEKVV
jgi:hypothetical protein